MTPPVDKILGCPACGMRVTGLESVCPRCGKKFDSHVKFECPFCGELILIGATKCPICKVDLSGVSKTVRTTAIDRNLDELMTDLIEIEASRVKEEGKRFCCPNCSWLLEGSETKCPRCSQVLTGRLGLQCPICGTAVEKGLKECPKCGIALEKVKEEAKPMVMVAPPTVVKPAVIPKPGVEKAPVATRPCPICGSDVPSDLQKCAICGSSFIVEPPKPKVVIPPPKVPARIKEADEALQALREIEKQAQKPFRERKLRSEKVTKVDIKVQPGRRGLSNGIGQVNGTSMVNGRSRINGTSMVNGRSRINGTGMVNGQSKINGTGAVNGKSLVNGTGISNGLRARARERASRHTAFLTRWQFLAVLVAIAIVLPTFVILSYTKKSDELTIDGKFGDWAGATTYGTRIPSSSSRTNITEWAVASQSTDLFFYFKTQSRMMSSSEADSYCLFVDSDGSNSTGYIMESIGADYLLQVTGWDDKVNSTSISEFSSSTDRYNWSAWSSIGGFVYSSDGLRFEAEASMPVALSSTAKFMLVSKDSMERSSVSYAAPLAGGVLIVEQYPSDEVASDGIVPKASSVTMLSVRFTCEGEGGSVSQLNPSLVGATLSSQITGFSLNEGQYEYLNVTVDTSSAADGQLVSAKLIASGIVSSFASVDVVGEGASAYAAVSPPEIVIDGAFADWEGRISVDQNDPTPVTNTGVDIDEVGNVSTADDSYFYVSVEGEMCSGTFVPALITKPSGSGGGGGVVILPRHTAEDILRVYIDSDRSNATGYQLSLNSKLIGADQMIEVRGLFGRIVSSTEWSYTSGVWTQMTDDVEAAKDSKRIEIGITSASIGGSSDIDFIVETTTWKGRSDLASFDPTAMRSLTRRWVVDTGLSNSGATSMSYQRKIFYDGTNYWSFYFDGSNTVCRYSSDDGVTWTSRGSVFSTSGVNETSVWFDSSSNRVYAVGDTSAASTNVYLQRGLVAPASHTITWAGSDSTLASSSNALGGKNAFICKDSSGYLWVLSSNYSQTQPQRYMLTAFRSAVTDSTGSWVYSGQMLASAAVSDNIKGSIVPAGSGSNVWGVYVYAGTVAARKYTGSWQNPQTTVYTGGGSSANTDNSPPSVVVDSKGVVHVAYGTGRKTGQSSIPSIEYSYNNSGATTFVPGVDLDAYIAADVGDYYPSISLESSTNDLYVYWLQSDTSLVPKTVMGRICVSGSWSNITFESQTTYAKYHLTSIYSVSGMYKVSWQWTQNTTSPVQVLFDHNIPEFGGVTLPIIGFMVIFAIYRQRSKGSKDAPG